jgi:L-threonylcarbamoyladenylate synthase
LDDPVPETPDGQVTDGGSVEDPGPAVVPSDDPDVIAVAAATLSAGGIVGLPTETVYGVAVMPRPEPLQALLEAKRRPFDKGIPLLLDDLDQVVGLVIVEAVARRLADRFWPGPLTLVLPLRRPGSVPALLSGGRGSLALRIPDHPVPRALARQLGPIAVTSANLSGEPDARTAGELMASIGSSLGLVIDDGPVRGGVPSSVVAIDASGAWQLLREGAVQRSELETWLAEA